jgi:predicted nucleotidyltransferase
MSSTHIRNLFEKKDFEKVIQFTSKDSVNILNNYFKKFKE